MHPLNYEYIETAITRIHSSCSLHSWQPLRCDLSHLFIRNSTRPTFSLCGAAHWVIGNLAWLQYRAQRPWSINIYWMTVLLPRLCSSKHWRLQSDHLLEWDASDNSGSYSVHVPQFPKFKRDQHRPSVGICSGICKSAACQTEGQRCSYFCLTSGTLRNKWKMSQLDIFPGEALAKTVIFLWPVVTRWLLDSPPLVT